MSWRVRTGLLQGHWPGLYYDGLRNLLFGLTVIVKAHRGNGGMVEHDRDVVWLGSVGRWCGHQCPTLAFGTRARGISAISF